MSSCSLWRHCCVVQCSRGPILFSPTLCTSLWGKHRRTLSRHRLSWNLHTVCLRNRCTFSCRPRTLYRSNPAVLCNRVSKYQRRTGVCSALDPPKQQAVSPAPSSSCFPAVSWIWPPQFSSAPGSSVSALPPWRGDRWSRGGWRRWREGGRRSSAWRNAGWAMGGIFQGGSRLQLAKRAANGNPICWWLAPDASATWWEEKRSISQDDELMIYWFLCHAPMDFIPNATPVHTVGSMPETLGSL